jgi:hypothetical protein
MDTSKQAVLLQTLTTIFKPLVRLLIHQNITYIGLQNLLKKLYVKVAEESFTLKGKRQTDSRISLLTGVHRADVKRIRAEKSILTSEKEIKASLSAQIMSIWTGHQAYLDTNGHPVPLFRYTHDGSPSFEQLVLSISKDKHPRSFIDDWLNQGIIELGLMDGKESISLTEKGYIPEADFEEKLFFAGKNIGDHLSVVVHNLENQTPAMFDRAVYYYQLSEVSVKELEQLCKEKMMQVLVEINQKANQLQQQDRDKATSTHGMHVGAYYYRAQQEEEK